jgi:hypothetical protein
MTVASYRPDCAASIGRANGRITLVIDLACFLLAYEFPGVAHGYTNGRAS